MTDEERTKSILKEIEYDHIGYDNLHGDDGHGMKVIENALKKQISRKPKLFKGKEGNYDICPSCDGLLIYYLDHCHMCGQAIDWSEVG